MDCTEWQLSVEPGFAPYIPPRSFDEVEDDEPAEDDDTDIAPADEVPGERIEDVSLPLIHRILFLSFLSSY